MPRAAPVIAATCPARMRGCLAIGSSAGDGAPMHRAVIAMADSDPSVVLSEIQRDTLKQVCDTFVAAVDVARRPDRVLGPPGSDLRHPRRDRAAARIGRGARGPARRAARSCSTRSPRRASTRRRRPRASRCCTGSWTPTRARWPGLQRVRGPDADALLRRPTARHNPNWEAIGYPGPRAAPPSPDEAPKTISVTRPARRRPDADRRRRRRRLGLGRRRDRGRAGGRPARTSSCSRPAATTTRPTSTSSSCGPTRTSTAPAASRRPPTARSC